MIGSRGLVVAGVAGAAVAAIIKASASSTVAKARIIPRGRQLAVKSPKEISIISYNVLCDKFSTQQRLPHVLPQFLNYDYRWQLLQREIIEFDSDIICLQEATIDRWQELKQFMADLGYDCIVQLKPHEVKLAVFWRCSRLTLKWWEERSRALISELTLSTSTEGNISEEDTLFVVNVHLEGSPYRAADRVAQLRHALQRLAHHIEATGRDVGTAKLILVGDFNSLPGDSPCKFLRDGHLQAGYRDDYLPGEDSATDHDIDHPFILRDAYEVAHAVPPFTRKVNRTGARLDFVWVSPGVEVQGVMRPLPMEYRDLVERVGMPNYALPSDHLPVGAILQLAGNGNSTVEDKERGEEDEILGARSSDTNNSRSSAAAAVNTLAQQEQVQV